MTYKYAARRLCQSPVRSARSKPHKQETNSSLGGWSLSRRDARVYTSVQQKKKGIAGVPGQATPMASK
eukprot:4865531-Prymnesium_polylepis.1